MPVAVPLTEVVNAVPSSTELLSLADAVAGVCPVNSETSDVEPVSVVNDQVCSPSTAPSVETTPLTLTV